MSISTADTGAAVHAGLARQFATGAGNCEAVLAFSYSRWEVATGCAGTGVKAASGTGDLADPVIRQVMPRSN